MTVVNASAPRPAQQHRSDTVPVTREPPASPTRAIPPGSVAYPLHINTQVLDAMQQWSNDELRSLNAQIEYVLREALRKGGRLKPESTHKKS